MEEVAAEVAAQVITDGYTNQGEKEDSYKWQLLILDVHNTHVNIDFMGAAFPKQGYRLPLHD